MAPSGKHLSRVHPSTGEFDGGAAANPTRPHFCLMSDRCLSWILTTVVMTIIIIILVVFYYLQYSSRLPDFSFSSLKVSKFNLASSGILSAAISFNVTAKNPNKKNVVFCYNAITVSVSTEGGVTVGEGVVPAFIQPAKNITLLKVAVKSSGGEVDEATVIKLRSEMRSKSGVPLMINLGTEALVKKGGSKVGILRIRVKCVGIKMALPSGTSPSMASTANAEYMVDLRLMQMPL